MKCRIERPLLRFDYHVWLYDDWQDGIYMLDLSHRDAPERVKVDRYAANTPPTLVLPDEALHALVAEASGVLPPTDATTAHLKDAIAVRDRLLALVEHES